MLPPFPTQIRRFITSVFERANRRISEKIARVPNTPEESLDLTLIEHLSRYSAPRVVAPGWTVRIDVHYLGGLRHFRTWEIADIGLLVFAKCAKRTVAQKVALLQSKRLYPASGDINHESLEDLRIGFGRLLPDDFPSSSLGARTFRFDTSSKYRALEKEDRQYAAIQAYENDTKIPVYYMLYNPWRVPAEYSFPVTEVGPLGHKANGGCRIVPADKLRSALRKEGKGYRPAFSDLDTAVSRARAHRHGWRLEHFVSNRVLPCKDGYSFESPHGEEMFGLFNRRSGPIAAAIAITVEQAD